MQYKLIGNNDIENLIKTVLKNRGIEDWSKYVELNKVDDDEHKGLDNINEAVECFTSHMERGSDVGILFDTDT